MNLQDDGNLEIRLQLKPGLMEWCDKTGLQFSFLN